MLQSSECSGLDRANLYLFRLWIALSWRAWHSRKHCRRSLCRAEDSKLQCLLGPFLTYNGWPQHFRGPWPATAPFHQPYWKACETAEHGGLASYSLTLYHQIVNDHIQTHWRWTHEIYLGVFQLGTSTLIYNRFWTMSVMCPLQGNS